MYRIHKSAHINCVCNGLPLWLKVREILTTNYTGCSNDIDKIFSKLADFCSFTNLKLGVIWLNRPGPKKYSSILALQINKHYRSRNFKI